MGVRHIVAWNFREGSSAAENERNALTMKAELESLKNIVEGIVELELHVSVLPSSNRSIALNSLFVSEEALAAYQVHPEHKKIVAFAATFLQDRACVDYHEG
ncbi:MAG: Dabb family protein [Treponema sp.]|nr:Dabb family protein [Treponema sp.]